MNDRWGEVTRAVQATGRRVRRAWPRSGDHLLLDLLDGDAAVAGQWFVDPARAEAVARETRGAVPVRDEPAGGRLLLQPGGADRAMPGLAGLLRQPDTVLISHRPERRAVVRRRDADGARPVFLKVVPPRRLRRLAESARRAGDLPLRTPAVLGTDEALGAVITGAVPGRALGDWLRGPAAGAACRAVGSTLAAVHRLPADGLAQHGPSDEAAVTHGWEEWANSWATGSSGPGPNLPTAPRPPDRPALIHRDFHDGQVLVDEDLAVGVIDFDLMAAGDPALDVANFVCHLRLRERQGGVPAGPLIEAFLDGYAPDDRLLAALPYYRSTSDRRLAAVYAFRDAALAS